jgi:YVTN family beta-propeller protein
MLHFIRLYKNIFIALLLILPLFSPQSWAKKVRIKKQTVLLKAQNAKTGLKVPLSIVMMSPTLKGMLEDLVGTDVEKQIIIPLDNIDEKTLQALISSLNKLRQLNSQNKKYTFNELKKIITNSVFSGDEGFHLLGDHALEEQEKLLKFLLAANFLDFKALLGPAVAAIVDIELRTEPSLNILSEMNQEKLNELILQKHKKLEQNGVPRDLWDYFDGYFLWHQDQWPPAERTIDIESFDCNYFCNLVKAQFRSKKNYKFIIVDGYKSYIMNHGNNNITVIDLFNNKRDTIKLSGAPSAIAILNTTLYYALASNAEMSMFDLTTKKAIGGPTQVGLVPIFILPVADKLYVADHELSQVSLVDADNKILTTIKLDIHGDPIAMTLLDSSIYVANERSNDVSEIDINSNQVKGDPIKVGRSPSALSPCGVKIYVSNEDDNTVTVIDGIKKKVSDTIPVGQKPIAVAASKRLVFVANYMDNTVVAIDNETGKVIGPRINIEKPTALRVVNNKLYILTENGTLSIYDVNSAYFKGLFLLLDSGL